MSLKLSPPSKKRLVASHFSSQIGGHLEDRLSKWRVKCQIEQRFQKGEQLEDKLSNWRTWRTNCQIGGRPPDWMTFVLYGHIWKK